ncbi:FAD-dependent oxidoreductase [Roseibium sp.]|uniref:FAD-dependent oxidoreductase n=1 Tax=Roseibium sp. TaxID=1936156 RepID=UPI003A98730B
MSASVAIIGAGPSGCFLAQALLKADPELKVDLIDRLPVPYGLVRYGVAADHQGTKGITRQFERVFERMGATFIGNLAIGEDVSLDDLRACYDVVVLAAGLPGDRSLGIPGEDLDGVIRAGDLTRALYEHPDAHPLPKLGKRVVIMGNGNVAIDLLRILGKTPDELAGSDFGAGPSEWLAANDIETIDIVGRSAAEAAKFDPVMIKELSKLSGVTIRVEEMGSAESDNGQKKLDALATVDGHGTGPRQLTFRFGLTPEEITGEGGNVTGVRFRNASGEAVELACDSFITAVGFAAAGHLGRDDLVASAEDVEAGALAPGLYATGWFRRGPRGTIPENRADAQALATRILADLDAAGADAGKGERDGLTAGRADLVDYAGWKRIDEAETADLPADRTRRKIACRQDMLALALQKSEEING